jgi:hypothetical protein
MIAISRRLLGLVLLLLAAALPLGCARSDDGPRDRRDVTVGGEHGVVVEHGYSGTAVKVGGDHGVVVGSPRDRTDDDGR